MELERRRGEFDNESYLKGSLANGMRLGNFRQCPCHMRCTAAGTLQPQPHNFTHNFQLQYQLIDNRFFPISVALVL